MCCPHNKIGIVTLTGRRAQHGTNADRSGSSTFDWNEVYSLEKIDVRTPYFMMSFKYDKTSPKEFGLQEMSDNINVSITDGSKWLKIDSHDFGWGSEIGFMRLPKLSFEELMSLLEHSPLDVNKYGAASVILSEHHQELFDYLQDKMTENSLKVTDSLREGLLTLGLDRVKNRTPIFGKSPDEIQDDFQKWKSITQAFNDASK